MQGDRLSDESFGQRYDESVWAWEASTPYTPQPAFAGTLDADVAIVGGGYTGVSTAYHLKRRFPERRIVLCEARVLGHGATGRSGGLVLNGVNGTTTDLELARRIFDTTRAGIDALERKIRDLRLPVAFRRNGCLEVFTSRWGADAAARDVERLNRAGIPLRYLEGRDLESVARLNGVTAAILDPTSGQINGLSFVRAMRQVILDLGVLVHEQSPVTRITEGQTHTLTLPGGVLRAKALVLATNAYTPALGYFRSRIVPIQSRVLATAPLPERALETLGWPRGMLGFSDDRDRIGYGSTTASGNIVFGGGSNAAYGYGFAAPKRHAFEAMERTLHRYLPALKGQVGVRHAWSGPVALTMDRMCTMGVRGKYRNVYFALGYSGHGITLANLAGEILTDVYSGDDARWRGLPFFQRSLIYVPPEPLRWLGYQAYTRLTGRAPRHR